VDVDLDTARGCGWILDHFVLLPLVVLAASSLVWRRVHLRHARRWRAVASGDALAMRPGWSIVRGVVETDPPDEPAVVVDVEQRGRVYSTRSKLSKTAWQEIARRTVARSFIVTCDDGARVRVDPDDRVHLVDPFDAVRRSAPDRRIRSARLTHGESAYVLGVLDQGASGAGPYREGPMPVMRPPSRGHMTISTEPLDKAALDRASTLGAVAVMCAVIVAVTYVLSIKMNVLRLIGRPGACVESITVIMPFVSLGMLILCVVFAVTPSNKLSDVAYGDLDDERHYAPKPKK
jgi:hypothetical protein